MLGQYQNREQGIMTAENNVLIRVENLVMHFPIFRGVVRRQVGVVHAVDGSLLIFTKEKLLVWWVNPVVANPPPEGRFCNSTNLLREKFILKIPILFI